MFFCALPLATERFNNMRAALGSFTPSLGCFKVGFDRGKLASQATKLTLETSVWLLEIE